MVPRKKSSNTVNVLLITYYFFIVCFESYLLYFVLLFYFYAIISVVYVGIFPQHWCDVPDVQNQHWKGCWHWRKHSGQRKWEDPGSQALDNQTHIEHEWNPQHPSQLIVFISSTSVRSINYLHRFVTVGWLALEGLKPEHVSSWFGLTFKHVNNAEGGELGWICFRYLAAVCCRYKCVMWRLIVRSLHI